MFSLFFILCSIILMLGSYSLLFKWNKIEKDIIKNENADDYLLAKEVFVRDPEAFQDKNHNGIDDIIDQNNK